MGVTLAKLWNIFAENKHMRLIMVGLDNSGKVVELIISEFESAYFLRFFSDYCLIQAKIRRSVGTCCPNCWVRAK